MITETQIIKKHKTLLESRYILSVSAIKTLSVIISMIHQDDEDFQTYHLNVKDVQELTQSTAKSLYDDLKKVGKELSSTSVSIPQEGDKEGFTYTTWVSHAHHEKGSGEITFSIHPLLKPYLLNLKHSFLQYELKNVLSLKSAYIHRLYEILKHQYNTVNKYKPHQRVVEYKISVQDLRDRFTIPESYQYSSHIKKHIIQNAQKQFYEATDIMFEYREHKKGRKVDVIEFIIRENDKTFDFLQSKKTFIKHIRANYINRTLYQDESQNLDIAVSQNGRLYNKRTTKDYDSKNSNQVWSNLYELAKQNKLKVNLAHA